MTRIRAMLASDPLDIEVFSHLKSAKRSVERALATCLRARRSGYPRFQTRKMYKDLMEVRTALDYVHSTVPDSLAEPEAYPEALHERVREIQDQVQAANSALRAARLHLRAAESTFRAVDATFAAQETQQILHTQRDLEVISVALSRVRGVAGGELEILDEPSIAPEVQEVVQESPAFDMSEESDV